MKIVLTGGTGLLGNALGQELVKRGHELHVMVRNLETARTRLSYPCRLWPWTEGQKVPAEALNGADVLVHLAGESVAGQRWSKARKQNLRSSRLATAQALAASVMEAPAGRLKAFVSASAVGYYGDQGDRLLDESSPAGRDFLAQLCVEWEAESKKVAAQRHVQLRFGVVLSNLGGFLKQVVPLFRRLGASRLGDGKQYFSWIHIEDVVGITVKAIEDASMSGAYNVTAPEPVTNAELTDRLAKALKAYSVPAAPKFALQWIYGELSQALLSSQRTVSKRLDSYTFRFPTLERALTALFADVGAGEMKSVFELWVPGKLPEIWEFFSSERNLERITPPFLNFRVEGKSTPQIQDGTLIDYRLKIRGIPAHWRTKIQDWNPPHRFSDQQLKGPYSLWYHVHDFEVLGEGVLLRDTVRWKLPMGALGRLTAQAFVGRDVETIFAYRSQVIGQIFYSR